eukprot:1190895-Prorocentrum_minimum.AAC.1
MSLLNPPVTSIGPPLYAMKREAGRGSVVLHESSAVEYPRGVMNVSHLRLPGSARRDECVTPPSGFGAVALWWGQGIASPSTSTSPPFLRSIPSAMAQSKCLTVIGLGLGLYLIHKSTLSTWVSGVSYAPLLLLAQEDLNCRTSACIAVTPPGTPPGTPPLVN